MRTLVLVTGATAAIWAMSQTPLVKIWAEAVFSNQVLVDTGHPGSYELVNVPPSKLAHLRVYDWWMSAIPAIDDRPRQPEVRYRTLCRSCMDRSPGIAGEPVDVDASQRTADGSRRDLSDLRLQRGGLRVSPLFFF